MGYKLITYVIYNVKSKKYLIKTGWNTNYFSENKSLFASDNQSLVTFENEEDATNFIEEQYSQYSHTKFPACWTVKRLLLDDA